LNGEVSDEHFEGVAVAILNAEAEGRQLNGKEIDSLLTAEERKARKDTKRDQRDRKREWRDLGERLEAYKEFETRMKEMVPPEAIPPDLPPPRPLYRVSRNFVVEIDTAAIAEMARHAEHFAARAPRVMVMHHQEALKELTRELPALKFEMRRIEMEMRQNDSLQVLLGSEQFRTAMQMKIADSLRRVFEHNPKLQKQMQWGWSYRQRADSIRKAHERYWRDHPGAVPPPPPLPPESAKEPKPGKPPE
jgi:hypothetical protein